MVIAFTSETGPPPRLHGQSDDAIRALVKRLEVASAGGLAAAVAAVLVSSCCALPMALVFAGISTGVVGLLGPLHALRPVILLAAAGLLGLGWTIAIRKRAERAYPILVLGSALLLVSLAWAWWDPLLQRVVMQSSRR